MLELLQKAVEQSKDCYYLMDANQNFIWANKKTVDMAGYRSANALPGTSYFDMNCKASEYADAFEGQDSMAINLARKIDMVGRHQYYRNGEWVLLLGSKEPIFEQGSLIGVFSHFKEIKNPRVLNFPVIQGWNAAGISSASGVINCIIRKRYDHFALTVRESECLFYMLRGYSARETGDRLGISSKTVESYIHQLKIKLNAASRAELIETALAAGLNNVLIESVFRFT